MGRTCVLACLALAVAACAAPNQSAQKDRIIGHTLAATVQLFTDRGEGVTRAGSGVVLAREGTGGTALILTTAHLLEPPIAQTVYAVSPTRTAHLQATTVAVDAAEDLALLTVNGLDGDSVALRPEANLGDRVWVVAFPWGRERTVVSGVVSQVDWGERATQRHAPLGGPVRLIDASVSYGMSGGGIFSHDSGELLGLVRGYRSAELSFPGAESGRLSLPVAGETTVIATPAIRCFLRNADTAERLAAVLAPLTAGADARC